MVDSERSMQWSLWGNQTTFFGAIILLAGGIIAVIGSVYNSIFLFWLPIGIYGLIFGLFISILEYPRGKKVKGHSVPRFKQDFLSNILDQVSYLKSFYYRSFLYFVISLPACLITPTFLGAVCILCGCFIYAFAARRGEVWNAINIYESIPKSNRLHVPPSRPPPRPHTASSGVAGGSNNYYENIKPHQQFPGQRRQPLPALPQANTNRF